MTAPGLSPMIIENLRARIDEAGLAGTLGEYLSTALLLECGLTMNAGMLVHDAEQLASVAEQLHYPVALKTAAAVERKSDVGGVGLDARVVLDQVTAGEDTT